MLQGEHPASLTLGNKTFRQTDKQAGREGYELKETADYLTSYRKSVFAVGHRKLSVRTGLAAFSLQSKPYEGI